MGAGPPGYASDHIQPSSVIYLLNSLNISLEAQAFSSQFGVSAQSVAQKTKSKNITKYVTLEYVLFCLLLSEKRGRLAYDQGRCLIEFHLSLFDPL